MYTFSGVGFKEHGQKPSKRTTGNFHLKGYPPASKTHRTIPCGFYGTVCHSGHTNNFCDRCGSGMQILTKVILSFPEIFE